MMSEMGTAMHGKKAVPPRRGMGVVCNYRSICGSKSLLLKATNDILGIIIALSRQLTVNAAKVSKRQIVMFEKFVLSVMYYIFLRKHWGI